MIIATAGHIDHGKTALVQALTEVDTDRLAEEKRRGLSIDLGFAYADYGGELPLGFIDVPGHERFIRNMLAGVAAVDYALLVIAADDGPMPQTREHLAILDLLGIRQGAVALTKIDRVTPARIQAARAEVQELLAGTRLAEAPVFPLSSLTGEGIPALRHTLTRVASNHRARRAEGYFRLTVDRCFTVRGAGWIATGTALSGSASVNDAVRLAPRGQIARIRAIHTHNAPADTVHAGQRCAINLAGDFKHQPVARGDWLVAPELHQPADRLDVSLCLPASAPGVLRHQSTIQLHLGAAMRNGRVALLEGAALAPGETGLAQLVLDSPVHAVSGDRFILRDPAARQTLAGGRVLDPFGPGRGRARPARLDLLRAIEKSGSAAIPALQQHLAATPEGVALEGFAQAFNLPEDRLELMLTTLDVARILTPKGPLGFPRARLASLSKEMLDYLDIWHAQKPDSLGLTELELGAVLGTRLATAVRRTLVSHLLEAGAIERRGFSLHRPGHEPHLSAADQQQFDPIAAILEEAGLRPPIVGELAERLGLPKPELLTFLERVQKLGYLARIAPNRYFLPSTVEALARIAVELAETSACGSFDAAAFRDRSGIGRNLTIQVLEYLDRAGVTRFGNERRSLQDPRLSTP